MRTFLLLLLTLMLTGCVLDPDYDQPPLDAPKDWRLIDHDARDLTGMVKHRPRVPHWRVVASRFPPVTQPPALSGHSELVLPPSLES